MMRVALVSLSLLTLVVAGCGPVVPSTARLVGITYTPDVGDTVTTDIEYDSDGRPERAEVQRGGTEIQEELFTFDGDGQLSEVAFTETDGALTLTTTVSYEWTDGRITRVTSEGAGVDDPEVARRYPAGVCRCRRGAAYTRRILRRYAAYAEQFPPA